MKEYYSLAEIIIKLNALRVEGHVTVRPYELLVYLGMLEWLDELMEVLICDVKCDVGRKER